MQTELSVAVAPVGMVTRHPAAFAGTNAVVLGLARMRDDDGGCAPRERDISLVHVMVVVSAVPSSCHPMIRNVAEGGIVKHACELVMSPRSRDHNPPGVLGWLLGKPSTSSESHCPKRQVPLVTRSVAPRSGATLDEQERAAPRDKSIAPRERTGTKALVLPWKVVIAARQTCDLTENDMESSGGIKGVAQS